MQAGLIVRAFLASPGDVKPEREEVCRSAIEWNAIHSLDREAMLEVVRIETHVQSEFGDHPQEIINSQLLGRCDFLIAVFWHRLGTPTNKKRSGTIHEIAAFAEEEGPEKVMVFFSDQPLPNNVDTDELREFREFKAEMRQKGLYIAYSDLGDFRDKLRNQIELRLNKLLKSPKAEEARRRNAIVDNGTGRVIGYEVPPPDNAWPRPITFKERIVELYQYFDYARNGLNADVPNVLERLEDLFMSFLASMQDALDEYRGLTRQNVIEQIDTTLILIKSAINKCRRTPNPGVIADILSDASRIRERLVHIAQFMHS